MKTMHVTKSRQLGTTLISWMVLLVILGVVAMSIIRLFPIYLEHMGVTSSMNSLQSDQSLRGGSQSEVRDALMRRMDVNDVDRVKSENVTIQRDGTVYRVNVAYEVVVPFIHNVSFLVTFDDTVELGTR